LEAVECSHQDALVSRHDVLGAVAVVHVKVDDRDPLEAMALQRVLRRDGDVVDEAEAHRLVSRGVVTRWSHGTEGVDHLPRHHRVGRVDGGTGSDQDGVPRMGVDRGVGVDLRVCGATRGNFVTKSVGQTAQGRQVHATMGEFDVGQRGRGGLAALQRHIQARDQQPVLDRVQPRRAFGVSGPHFVSPAIGVGEITGGLVHHFFTVRFTACTPTQKSLSS
jgi:hypothetical protein